MDIDRNRGFLDAFGAFEEAATSGNSLLRSFNVS